MKTILGVVFVLIAFPVQALVVTGEASSFELAQQQAFKKAIDYEVGLIVDTERSTSDRELTHNQILTYSAGYIKDYTLLSHEIYEPEGTHFVRMDVTVASSALKNFLLSRSDNIQKFNGRNIKTQIDYYKRSLVDGDRLVNNTLKYFPTDAIQVDAQEYSIVVDGYRKVSLHIPYTLSWKPEYLEALRELLSLFAISEESDLYFRFSEDDILYFHDRNLINLINSHMSNADFIALTVSNLQGTPLLNTCVQNIFYRNGVGWDSRSLLYRAKSNGVAVYDKSVENYISVPISEEIYNMLDDISQIEIKVVSSKDCP